MQLRPVSIYLIAIALTVASCASEDPNILDPSPSTMKINMRFVNMVADDAARRLLLERGVQTSEAMPGSFTATVGSPADSSLIEIAAAGTTEFKSLRRVSFIRNATANVIATGSGPADSALVQTVILPLTGATVSAVRVTNLVPDTNLTYEVRRGCPSGPSITPTPLRYRGTSLYADVVPGLNVFSILERNGQSERTVGIVECTLAPYRPHNMMIYRTRGNAEPVLLLLDESDTTTNATRSLSTVTERVAEVRVVNMSSSVATARLEASGQDLATNIAPSSLSAYTTVPTCVSLAADRVTLTLADGRTSTDSTIFSVRRRTSIIVADDAAGARSIIVPPVEGSIPAGMARVRVVHALASAERVVVSVGGRSEAGAPNGVSAGTTLARGLGFAEVSAHVDIMAGVLPLSITTARTPTMLLHVTKSELVAGQEYLLVIGSQNGALRTWLVSEQAQASPVTPTDKAALLRFVNAIPGTTAPSIDIEPALRGGKIYYRNSVATSVPLGGTEVRIDGIEESVPTADGERTLVVLTDSSGIRDLLAIMTPPLAIVPKQSERRVLNATKDIPFVSVGYDSIPKNTPLAPKLASRVAYGQLSPVDRTTVDRRGTFFIYDDDAKTELYKLPMSFTPLGNSATLIVVGSREAGYDVIVLQEF